MLTVKTRMYIGTRKTEFRQHDGSYPFDVLVMMDMGKVDGGGLLNLVNGSGEHLVRLQDLNAAELATDMYLRPLTSFDAQAVLSTIKADIFERTERGANYHYQVALAALEILTADLRAAEVVLEAYTAGRI